MADDFLGAWEAFRAAREERLTAPHGFLSITGLHWLDSRRSGTTARPAPGGSAPDGVEVELGPERVADDRRPGDPRAPRARTGGRGRDPGRGPATWRSRSPAATAPCSCGRATPPTPCAPSTGRRRPSRRRRTGSCRATFHALDGDRPIDEAIGEVAFRSPASRRPLVGVRRRRRALARVRRRDVRRGRRTAPGRQLYAPAPAADGSVVLDFNRTINLPCAYTDFTTCPVPLPQNRLQFAIEAGEQIRAVSRARAGVRPASRGARPSRRRGRWPGRTP